jgi:type I restriction enzyme S subunit
MMSDYWTTIGEVAEVYDGPHATPKKIGEGPYFLSISSLENGALDLSKSAHLSEEDFKKWTKRITPQRGDVLFSYETRLGAAAMMPSNVTACLGRRMGLLRPNSDKVIPEYLLYAYLSPVFQETLRSKTIHGATVDRIALKEVPSFPVRVPPKEEQLRTVGVLKSLSSKIELNRQTNQTFEQIAQAIFKSWFVDFEPVKAKIQAKRTLNPTLSQREKELIVERAAMCAISGKSLEELEQLSPETQQQLKTTAALFPDALVESELGEIPEGWKIKMVQDFGKVITGKTPPKKIENAYIDMGVSFITPTDIDDNIFVTSTIRCLSEDGQNAVENVKIDSGSICVTCIGSQMGKSMITPEVAFTNQQINSIIVSDNIFRNYLYLNLRNRRKEIFHIGSSGSTMPIINKSTFEKLAVLMPSEGILRQFNLSVNNVINKILESSKENISLTKTRDTLLPKLLSGELTPDPTTTKEKAEKEAMGLSNA